MHNSLQINKTLFQTAEDGLTTSPATAITSPFSSSANRRRASCRPASSISGVTAESNASFKRSTNSATCSRGRRLASSMI